MPEEIELIEDAKVLEEKLREILIAGSLYRIFAYKGKACHSVNRSAQGDPRYGLLPKELKMFCDNERCKADTLWETGRPTVYFAAEFIEQRNYTCRNCGKNTQYYQLIWQEQKDANVFIKVGQ
jgi:hypothetical protein